MHADPIPSWLRTNAARLGSADPVDVPDEHLQPLLDAVGAARVIALGESMHRTHEFLAWRERILRLLIEHAGFTALVIESGFPEGRLVDRWVDTGDGRLRDVLNDGITYHFGKCQEALDLAVWMRRHNTSAVGAPVHFYGMDVSDSAASPLSALSVVIEFLEQADPEFATRGRTDLIDAHDFLPTDRSGLARAAPAIQSYLALGEGQRYRLTAKIAALVERVRARSTDYVAEGVHPETVAFAVRAAEVARGTDAFLAAMLDGASRTWPPANIRDATMADTVEWILEREQRVLLFAANGHIRKTPYLAPPFVAEPFATVGTHLHARLGDDYRVIGSTFGGGETWLHRPAPDGLPGHSTPFVQSVEPLRADSLDGRFAAADIGSFLVDLRSASPDAAAALDRVSGTQNGRELEPADIRSSFDLMLHVGRVTPWHTWIDDHGHWA